MNMPSLLQLKEAARVVHEVMPPTPQYRWPLLEQALGATVWVKHENHTPLGAFKLRGGLVWAHELIQRGERPAGLVCATRGNHGQSVGFVASRHRLPACVVVPHGNSREKNRAMRALGVELVEHGDDFQAAFEHAQQLATARDWTWVPSFAEPLVRGVASYALELFEAVRDLDTVYVPIGLGSGACGVLAARDALGLQTDVVGVVSTAAPAYALSLTEGRPVEHPATTLIADGVACRTPNAEALAILRRGLSRIVMVTDGEVESAMRELFEATHQVAEGAGAAAWAAARKERARICGTRIAVVLSGGNVDREVYARVLCERSARSN
jgi:threonine dehydratase